MAATSSCIWEGLGPRRRVIPSAPTEELLKTMKPALMASSTDAGVHSELGRAGLGERTTWPDMVGPFMGWRAFRLRR